MTLVFVMKNGSCRVIPGVTAVRSCFDQIMWDRPVRGETQTNCLDADYVLDRYQHVYALVSMEEGWLMGVDHIKWIVYNGDPVIHLLQDEVQQLMGVTKA